MSVTQKEVAEGPAEAGPIKQGAVFLEYQSNGVMLHGDNQIGIWKPNSNNQNRMYNGVLGL